MWFWKNMQEQEKEEEQQEQEVLPGPLARFWAEIKRRCFWTLIGLLVLAGVYIAGILTVTVGPRHFGSFELGIWPGEVAEVVRLNEEFTKPWFGLGEAKSRYWLYVKRPHWKGDFPFLASGDELTLRPGDYVMRESSTGHFRKLAWMPKATSREVAANTSVDATDLPLPPPPKALVEVADRIGLGGLFPSELSPEDQKHQAEFAAHHAAAKTWGPEVAKLKARFSGTQVPVIKGVPDEEPLLQENRPAPRKFASVGKRRR